ncbi:hypothetical protein H2199_007905 [Coniosporium tulheliwenetii]|nr:hypothetical protein H2199_007905 [Cladosporium sp. JES 115]
MAANLTSTASSLTPAPTISSTASSTAAPSSTSEPEDEAVLSTGAIIGIACGGGITLVGCVAVVAWYCIHKRKLRTDAADGPNDPNTRFYPSQSPPRPPFEMAGNSTPLYAGHASAYSPTDSSTRFSPSGSQSEAGRYQNHSQAGMTQLYPEQGDAIEHWRRQAESRGEGFDRVAELPAKRATVLERELSTGSRTDGRSYAEGDDWGYAVRMTR